MEKLGEDRPKEQHNQNIERCQIDDPYVAAGNRKTGSKVQDQTAELMGMSKRLMECRNAESPLFIVFLFVCLYMLCTHSHVTVCECDAHVCIHLLSSNQGVQIKGQASECEWCHLKHPRLRFRGETMLFKVTILVFSCFLLRQNAVNCFTQWVRII